MAQFVVVSVELTLVYRNLLKRNLVKYDIATDVLVKRILITNAG